MNIHIFSEQTAYGEFVRVITAPTKEIAYNYSTNRYKSLKELGWNPNPETTIKGNSKLKLMIQFDGGGDNS